MLRRVLCVARRQSSLQLSQSLSHAYAFARFGVSSQYEALHSVVGSQNIQEQGFSCLIAAARRTSPASTYCTSHTTPTGPTTATPTNELSDEDVDMFRAVEAADGSRLGANEGVLTGNLDKYNIDWMRKYQGASRLVLRPTDCHQISQILRHCSSHRLAVVPQGGNSSLSGGAVPISQEVIISTDRMTSIRSFDEVVGD